MFGTENVPLKVKMLVRQYNTENVFQVKRQGVHLAKQNRKLTELGQKMSEQDTVIAELKKHLQEWDHILGHQKNTLLSGISAPVPDPPTPTETPEVPTASTSALPQESAAETSATEGEESEVKECNCDNREDGSDETSPGDEKSSASRGGPRCKRASATKRKMKFEQPEDMARSRYNPIMDAIRAKRVCLFLEELQG